jgi:hypothetical protein
MKFFFENNCYNVCSVVDYSSGESNHGAADSAAITMDTSESDAFNNKTDVNNLVCMR